MPFPQVLSSPANTYSPSFCFIDHETVAHVNLRDNTIETRKILIASDGDGDIYLQCFRKFNIPLSPTRTCQLIDARWSGDYPPPVTSTTTSSCLPFQSNIESSVVALTLSYTTTTSSREQRQQQQRSFRAIIPRAKLLAGQWDTSSYRLFTLGYGHAPSCSTSWTGGCAIAGTRWINQCLQVFDFNRSRVLLQQTPTRVLHTTEVPAGSGFFFERDVRSALPFCHVFPKNQFGDVFDGVMADDERVVAFRYKVSRTVCVFLELGVCVLTDGARSIMTMDLLWM